MKDRQFMTLLALVVGAGLVMGLIASRMTGRGAASPAAVTTDTANSAKPGSSAAGDQQADDLPASSDTGTAQDAARPTMHDGESPDVATPEPAPPPPPEAPPPTVSTDVSQ